MVPLKNEYEHHDTSKKQPNVEGCMGAETQECVRSKARSVLTYKPSSLITNEQFQAIKTSCANEQQSELTNQAQMKALEGP